MENACVRTDGVTLNTKIQTSHLQRNGGADTAMFSKARINGPQNSEGNYFQSHILFPTRSETEWKEYFLKQTNTTLFLRSHWSTGSRKINKINQETARFGSRQQGDQCKKWAKVGLRVTRQTARSPRGEGPRSAKTGTDGSSTRVNLRRVSLCLQV